MEFRFKIVALPLQNAGKKTHLIEVQQINHICKYLDILKQKTKRSTQELYGNHDLMIVRGNY